MIILNKAIASMLVFFACAFGVDSESLRVKTGVICQTQSIVCNGNLKIFIVNATFGAGVSCGRKFSSSSTCTLNVTSEMKKQCQCKSSCEVQASQSFYQNSCDRRRLYMTLSFACIEATNPICDTPAPTTTPSPSFSSTFTSLAPTETTPTKSNNTLIALAVVLVVVVILTIIFVWMCIKKRFQCTFSKLMASEEHVYDVVLAETKPPNPKGVFRLREQSEGDENARRRLADDPLPATNNVIREEPAGDSVSQAPTLREHNQDVYDEIFASRKTSDREDTQQAQFVYNELYVPKEIYEETSSKPIVYDQLNESAYSFAKEEDEPSYNELTRV